MKVTSIRGLGSLNKESTTDSTKDSIEDSSTDSIVAPTEVSRGAFDGTRPMGVYVHFPFCSALCPYCDFAVDTRAAIPHEAYADAVIAELEARAPWFRPAVPGSSGLVSIYFGGGTPALWRVEAFERVLATARRLFEATAPPAAAEGAALEITIEANPGEVDGERLRALRSAGVNRLSLGVQSLDDRLLRAIGRNHDAAAAPAAMAAARAAGFENISIDLMFGLPGQSSEDWQATLAGAVALQPEHVSAYALTIERATAFGSRMRAGTLVVPDSPEVADMQIAARDALAAAGFAQYEVSSYARSGRRAIHNSLYWTGGAYLGVGASASSFRPLADGKAWRFTNARATDTYVRAIRAGSAPPHVERRTAADLENEAVWLALRTTDGLDRARHATRHGHDPLVASSARATAARACVQLGWLVITDEWIRPTPQGLLFADEVATRLWVDR
jgi:oxygen-independent coproporphyrinogen-3 oxidase